MAAFHLNRMRCFVRVWIKALLAELPVTPYKPC
jgi:hypothetical protein